MLRTSSATALRVRAPGACGVYAALLMFTLASCSGGGGGGGNPGNGVVLAGSSVNYVGHASGVVRGPGGVPLAGVTVTAYQTNDHTSLVTTTDTNGAYAFTDLLIGSIVHYEIRAAKAGYGFYPVPANSSADVHRADYNALYRTVMGYFSLSTSTLTGGDFDAFDGSNPRVSLAQTGQGVSVAGGDDGALQRGVPWPTVRFIDHADGTITDALTGLVWLKAADCLGTLNWPAALAAANQLASGTCGLTDGSTAGQWRMPNINELESLVDASRSNPALPAGQPFTLSSNAYWSSTTYFGVSTEAWVLRLSDGRYLNDGVNNFKATNSQAAWAVKRSSGSGGAVQLRATGQYVPYAAGDDGNVQSGVGLTSLRFVDKGDGTVLDTMTGLVWLKRADCINLSWGAALSAINALASGQCGLSDGSAAGSWRMPNRAEMLSLSDRTLGNHADDFIADLIDEDHSLARPAIFSNFMTAMYYWTSTTDAADPNAAWTVYSCDFGVYDIAKASTGYALAVR